jgi:hypothetical protein
VTKSDSDKCAYVCAYCNGQGEWHTFPYDYVPRSAWDSVFEWYHAAFTTTKLQIRYPYQPAYEAGFGLSDGSFTVETVGGEANGGVDYDFFFVTSVEREGVSDFWRRGPMGGETRNENQGRVFKPDYVPGYGQQDFMLCVNVTHASYM